MRDDEGELRAAVEAGDADARFELGALLARDVARRDEAEVHLREAVAAGRHEAFDYLAWILVEQVGREQDTIDACERALEHGSTIAQGYLGSVLARLGRSEEAARAFEAAIEVGDDRRVELWQALADLPDRRGEAIELARELTRAGQGWVNEWLAWALLKDGGDPVEAEWVSRAAIAHGSTVALDYLASALLAQEDREDEAEAALEAAHQAGSASAAYRRARLVIRDPTRQEDAEAAFRAAIGRGHERALLELGLLLCSEPERRDETLALYEAAVAAGHEQAWTILAGLLTMADAGGYNLGAELADAVDPDEIGPDDPLRRGMMLALSGRIEEAEASFRDGVQDGDLKALIAVAFAIAGQPGRRDDVERVLRLAALADIAEAALLLGALLTDQPGRQDEARAFYGTALDAGLTPAEWGLALLS